MTFAERLIWHLGRKYGYRLARHRNKKLFRTLEVAGECFLHYYNNRFYDLQSNGEARVLRCLSLPPNAVVLDVGAHTGNYTTHIRTENPNAVVHAFEINPRNADVFAARFKEEAGVYLHRVGLSDKPGFVVMRDFSSDGQITSMYGLSHAAESAGETFRAKVETGSEVLRTSRICEVYFLKIDTEGHDLNVLRGFLADLEAGRVHVIQFEYNETSIAARVYLKDFFDLLEPLGFELGKVFARTVEFQRYSTTQEDHRASNWVAVGQSEFAREVRRRLAGKCPV